MLYFAEAQKRVPVLLTETLVARTLQLLSEARRAAKSEILPPPLVQSPKCGRCSLVSICLPDEINLLRSDLAPGALRPPAVAGISEVRRLIPARDDGMPLYIQGHACSDGISGELLEIREKGKLLDRVRLLDVTQLCLFGNIQISAQALRELASREIPIIHLSSGGWLVAVTTPPPQKNIELRKAQFAKAADASFALSLSTAFVSGKIRNCRTLLRRNASDVPKETLSGLVQWRGRADRCDTMEQLLGCEGMAAREYFSHFAQMLKSKNGGNVSFDFHSRNRRPPRDLFLFYLFWEAMLIPMYFLIGIWGGPRRIYAAVKFFLYTIAGSLLMLVAILYIYNAHWAQSGSPTFNIFALYNTTLGEQEKFWMFLAFSLAFAIKIPIFPFHTWLPDAHTEAPTAGSVILAGVLLKMGIYGFLRLSIPMFPDMAFRFAPIAIVLGLIGIVYGALVAMVQQDIKKMVAYSSVSHLGFVMIGMFAFNEQGLHGAMLQMINHGLSTGALFLLVGMIYERRHTRIITEFGGIAKQMPVYFFLFLIVLLSSIGLPLLNGFVGEFLIFLGTFKVKQWMAIVAVSGIIWGAVYMLWMFQRVMFGPLSNPANKELKDLTAREIAIIVPMILLMFWIGIYSNSFLRKIDVAVNQSLERVVPYSEPVLSKK